VRAAAGKPDTDEQYDADSLTYEITCTLTHNIHKQTTVTEDPWDVTKFGKDPESRVPAPPRPLSA
jgi:hypothetical protein